MNSLRSLGAARIPFHAILLFVLLLSSAAAADAEIRPNALFTDHMVLQRGQALPVWGRADAGERVTVTLAGQTQSAVADAHGRWRVTFPAITEPPSRPLEMQISSADGTPVRTIRDILVGEVWICSGQSNMDFPVQAAKNGAKEVAAADHPQIRLFHVPIKATEREQEDVDAKWEICSPATVASFSAVGYFFGRDLHEKLGVPIGLIHSSVGGTPAEAWTVRQTLKNTPALADIVVNYQKALSEYPKLKQKWVREHNEWKQKVQVADPGNTKFAEGWAKPDFDDAGWKTIAVPGVWEKNGGPNIDGAVWFRRAVEVPEHWAGRDLGLHLGRIDDGDVTYFNGEQIAETPANDLSSFVDRRYTVPGKLVHAGRNVIAVRIFDQRGDGGFEGPAATMELGPATLDRSGDAKFPLAGQWKFAVEFGASPKPWVAPPPEPMHADFAWAPSNLYNAMILPLEPFAIKGVIWYQGESNAPWANRYEALLGAMITGWRNAWNQPQNQDFPFLIVQLANWNAGKEPTGWPEVRQAQANVARKLPNAGLAVTIDIGEPNDIHPKNKQEVGRRLSLQAQKIAYGRDVIASGPTFKSLQVEDGKAIVTFDDAEGLKTNNGDPVAGFEIAGADGKFVPAAARIAGQRVIVSAESVPEPKAVRYGWAANPQPIPNLGNAAGLPAVPFRSSLPDLK